MPCVWHYCSLPSLPGWQLLLTKPFCSSPQKSNSVFFPFLCLMISQLRLLSSFVFFFILTRIVDPQVALSKRWGCDLPPAHCYLHYALLNDIQLWNILNVQSYESLKKKRERERKKMKSVYYEFQLYFCICICGIPECYVKLLQSIWMNEAHGECNCKLQRWQQNTNC